MRVLVGCEYSGTVREAFKALGHDAWSCDLEPTDISGQHYQCSVFDVLDKVLEFVKISKRSSFSP